MIPNLTTLDIQEGKLCRPFKNTSVQRVQNTSKWIGRELKHHWLHIFKYIDNGDFFAIEIDYYGKPIKVIKHYGF